MKQQLYISKLLFTKRTDATEALGGFSLNLNLSTRLLNHFTSVSNVK